MNKREPTVNKRTKEERKRKYTNCRNMNYKERKKKKRTRQEREKGGGAAVAQEVEWVGW